MWIDWFGEESEMHLIYLGPYTNTLARSQWLRFVGPFINDNIFSFPCFSQVPWNARARRVVCNIVPRPCVTVTGQPEPERERKSFYSPPPCSVDGMAHWPPWIGSMGNAWAFNLLLDFLIAQLDCSASPSPSSATNNTLIDRSTASPLSLSNVQVFIIIYCHLHQPPRSLSLSTFYSNLSYDSTILSGSLPSWNSSLGGGGGSIEHN